MGNMRAERLWDTEFGHCCVKRGLKDTDVIIIYIDSRTSGNVGRALEAVHAARPDSRLVSVCDGSSGRGTARRSEAEDDEAHVFEVVVFVVVAGSTALALLLGSASPFAVIITSRAVMRTLNELPNLRKSVLA